MESFKFTSEVRKGRGQGPEVDLSEESDSSLRSARSEIGSPARSLDGSLRRKRERSRKSVCDANRGIGSGSEEEAPAVKLVAARRGRGRPPTTGEYVGLAKAKAELVAAERQEMQLKAEREVADMTVKLRSQSSNDVRLSESSIDDSEELASDLNKRVLDSVATINSVAAKSSNLKGTFQRALKVAATTIKEAMDDLSKRSSTEETQRLQAANTRLRDEVAELRKEITELRKEMTAARTAAPPQPRPVEELEQAILRQVGGMLSARFEALEERLLPEKRTRPPLAADRRNAMTLRTSSEKSVPGPSTAFTDVTEMEVTAPTPKPRKGKGKGKKTKVAPSNAEPTQEAPMELEPTAGPSVPRPAPVLEQWSKVVRRGARKSQKMPAASREGLPPSARTLGSKPAGPAKAPKAAKLRPPRTAAVIITLQPGAAEQGLSYAKVLAEAKASINLGELGLPPMTMRTAATGARVIEVPGAEKTEKANILAAKLKEVFRSAEEHILVTRPVIMADMRVSGLDDTVTAQELKEALSKTGDCPPDEFKVGEIRKGPGGMGTVFVRSPVTAAKKIAAGGRLLVGWVAAQVKILESRPRRCYRCLAPGHVRAQCKAEVDRSEECYRCGQTGHRASVCTAAPNCSRCAAAGKPAGHLSGGKACAKPPGKSKVKAKLTATEAPAKSQTTSPPGEQVLHMEEQ